VRSIVESKLELWEIYQNYATFLRCLYWNSFEHHRLPCFREVRRNGAEGGAEYNATLTAHDIGTRRGWLLFWLLLFHFILFLFGLVWGFFGGCYDLSDQ
jgi:hypothetical protein